MTRARTAGLVFLFLVLCVAFGLFALKARQRILAPDPRELFAVVNAQLAAFRAGDFPAAYRHVAHAARGRFDLGQFEKMVRSHYPEMIRSERVEFGVVKIDGENALVRVFFFNANGSARSFLYSLVIEADAWKIDGVEEMGGQRASDRLAGSHA